MSKKLTKREYSEKYKISLTSLRWQREQGRVQCELVAGEWMYEDSPPASNNTAKRKGWAIAIDKISSNEFYLDGELLGASGVQLPAKGTMIELDGISYLGMMIKGQWDFEQI